jgi:hypothetical protein
MRKYGDCEKIDFRILKDLQVFSLVEYKKVIFGKLFVCGHLHNA